MWVRKCFGIWSSLPISWFRICSTVVQGRSRPSSEATIGLQTNALQPRFMWRNVNMEPTPGTKAWYAQVTEDIIEPERPIVDPHHHLWSGWEIPDYLLEDLWGDTGSGHKILKTVFIECGARYRETGPDHLKPVGETEFVADIAVQSAAAD